MILYTQAESRFYSSVRAVNLIESKREIVVIRGHRGSLALNYIIYSSNIQPIHRCNLELSTKYKKNIFVFQFLPAPLLD